MSQTDTSELLNSESSAPESEPHGGLAVPVESPPRSARSIAPVLDDPRARLVRLSEQLRTRMDRKLLVDFLRLRVATRHA